MSSAENTSGGPEKPNLGENRPCTCAITGPGYDDTQWDYTCPYHGENGTMVSRFTRCPKCREIKAIGGRCKCVENVARVSSAENGKLVWITADQCDYLLRHPATEVDRAIARAWHKAPADPAEAAILAAEQFDAVVSRQPYPHEFARVVLGALGVPPEREAS